MAGIYLHIPFCKQACNYCNFHFNTSLFSKSELIYALDKEIKLKSGFFGNEIIQTIYFGGGTPSLLSIEECDFLIQSMRQNFEVMPEAEITLEANPDDITLQKLKSWKLAGINRLSIGIQSFFNEDLSWMNRAHDSEQARNSLDWACSEFGNISLDLIYGTPLLTDEMWHRNIETALSYSIPHLSCYALTVEEKTPLHKQIHSGKKGNIDPDKQSRHFTHLMRTLKEKGYEHYEVSNFALPGFRSRHNSSYWQGEKYLGLGPSAHSYNGFSRTWNIANNGKYIQAMETGLPHSETEILTEAQKLNEYIMISLRTIEGMDLELVRQKWGQDKIGKMEKKISVFTTSNLLLQNGFKLQLTEEGMLLADGIAADLFVL